MTVGNSKLTRELKSLAFNSKVDLIGVADPKVFDDLPLEDKPMDILSDAKAIVVYAVQFKDANCVFKESWYKKMEKLLAYINKKLGGFLTEKGYKAVPFLTEVDFIEEIQGQPFNERTLGRQRRWRGVFYKLQSTAASAGLGWLGKNRTVVTPQYGPCAFLNMIVTDAPLVPDEPFAENLCADCDLCLKACPTGAIFGKGHPDPALCRPREDHFACVRVCHEKILKQKKRVAKKQKSS